MAKKSEYYVDKEILRAEIIKCQGLMDEYISTLDYKLNRDQIRLTASQHCSPKLQSMLLLIAAGMSHRYNFKGYTFREDMEHEGVIILLTAWYKFNPTMVNKKGILMCPFSYMSQICYHKYVTFIVHEKKQKRVTEEMMMSKGILPSWGTQVDIDMAIHEKHKLE